MNRYQVSFHDQDGRLHQRYVFASTLEEATEIAKDDHGDYLFDVELS